MLDSLTAREAPSITNPDVRDTATGEMWPKHDRCPDCRDMAWGPCYPRHNHQRRDLRVHEGWLTIASCGCGRLRETYLQPRSGDYWDTQMFDVWGPFAARPDVAAWMAGADREQVLA